MGQIEVYEWLKQQRRRGNHRFHTITEIKRGLIDEGQNTGQNTRSNLLSLKMYGYVESRTGGKVRDWQMRFRIKNKYCKK